MNKIGIISALLFCLGTTSPTAYAAIPTDDVAIYNPTPELTSGRGSIELKCPDSDTTYTFHIFSITGQLIKSVTLSGGSHILELPQGCYIVKCQQWAKKVIVS